MEHALKQRLVGAGVIVALGVIFIPMFLDGSGEKVVREIPLPPAQTEQAKPGMVKPEVIPVPEVIKPEINPVGNQNKPVASNPPPSAAKLAPDGQQQKTVVAKSEAIKTPAKPPVTEKPVAATRKATPPATKSTTTAKVVTSTAPKSWVVQVGSFSEQPKALKLRDQLRKKKYRAFVEHVSASGSKSLYRVRIGPELKRADAEKVQQQLLKTEKIKGYVTHHP